MWNEFFLGLLGGMGLLLFGMQMLSESLQTIAGLRLKIILSTLTKNRFVGMLLGVVITVLFQSSTATSVILVGLTSASIITLNQTLSVLLGSGIGTTITAQLIAFKITEVALPMVGIGAMIIFFTKRVKHRQYGLAILGFGLTFLGLKIMSDTMYPLRDDPFFQHLMVGLENKPFLAMLIASLFAFLVHSSAATIGIIMLLAMQGLTSLESAIFLLFGANIGTCFTAILSSLGSSRESQRVAFAQVLFKIIGVVIMLPIVHPFADFVAMTTSNHGHQVANAHTVYNILVAVVCLPFLNKFESVLSKIIPDKKESKNMQVPRYLNDESIKSPVIGIGLATRETLHMSDHVSDMTFAILKVFKENDPELLEYIMEKEKYVDILARETSQFLAKILRQTLTKADFNRCIGLMNIVNDFEHIGDIIEKYIIDLAKEKYKINFDFSEKGWQELNEMHERVCEIIRMVSIALATNNQDLAREVLSIQPELFKLEKHFRQRHIDRLMEGAQCTEETSSIHLDLINAFLRISDHVKNIANTIVSESLEVDIDFAKREDAFDGYDHAEKNIESIYY
ncbi:Na/Pi-cotransporter II-related protein [Desulfofarcimen acetoxidans DSM 771]|jgi:phosphate:Na+ symporter|uniref:Na/Pi-cotransporter II-related protein n=1 Tax=Desulfofarcimen acetoxidans (strain ATCC 49208 / DSM 771 / KCTC 5769 / VKM B-1644 / 5575) TaxID=485916 RepID=C8W3B2_DESAS|nr:Na/Pi cotransporter family protein [Desulfofarcimen acetoxidans]ACV61879.1 Na/Pi-cotransporter II-related protein [Desulfofarcimen acetoxidans DSM 771]